MAKYIMKRGTSDRLLGTSPNMRLSIEGRLRERTQILAKAAAIFGSREAAERWLERPALGLDQQRPIDLMETPAGVRLVEDFLGRLEYGVYG